MDTPTCDVRRSRISKRLVAAYHTHTLMCNMSHLTAAASHNKPWRTGAWACSALPSLTPLCFCPHLVEMTRSTTHTSLDDWPVVVGLVCVRVCVRACQEDCFILSALLSDSRHYGRFPFQLCILLVARPHRARTGRDRRPASTHYTHYTL